MTALSRLTPILLLAPILAACSESGNDIMAVGTVERDRAELRATAAETVGEVLVDDGQSVEKGDLLLALDTRKATARLRRAEAELAGADARLAEVRRGARQERLDQARAALVAARSEAQRARSELQRISNLAAENIATESQLEEARKAAEVAAANVDNRHAALSELLNGATPEQLAQAEAAVDAAAAAVSEAQSVLDDLRIHAPFDGMIEQVLVEPGDRTTPGQVVATVYRQGAPYVQVFLPATERDGIAVGNGRAIRIDGHGCVPGKLRFVSAEASFTPYYALREEDRGRLAYRAEFLLDDADDLAVGLPASVLASESCPRP